jgi:curved DNA-binding protein CbpA
MPRARTHYDNLKVARDAPIEVIRAAYKSLAIKYHPDHNTGNEQAARATRIINEAYSVLSDPAKRLEHDLWIERQAAEWTPADPEQQPKPPPRRSPARETAAPQFATDQKPDRTLLKVAVAFLVLVILGIYASISFKPHKHAASQQPIPVPGKAPALEHPRYIRKIYAPNGAPWPSNSGYVAGYQQLSPSGLSTVTIDNMQNESDVFVGLFDHRFEKPQPVRWFFISARGKFTIENVKTGTYDIRYQNLDSGAMSKSEPFELREIEGPDETKYSVVTLTLFTVLNGNTRFETIGPEDFAVEQPD